VDVADWFAGLNEATWLARASRDPDLERRLDQARTYIDGHFDRAIDLDAMAHSAAFSRFHFHRLFRHRFGVTPHEYLTEKRVARARELLGATEMPITEVCAAVGFESLGSFSTLFRRHVGHAPSRYRRVIVQNVWHPLAHVPWCFFARSEKSATARPT
jgi:AraC-like DNA-binding protein